MSRDSFARDRIDTTRPHSARVWDFWLGGKDHYAVDRDLGERIATVFPPVVDMVHGDREFMRRVVTHAVADLGIRQVLDLGSGLPTEPNVHQVAQEIAADARVVYVDHDPIVSVHARALLSSTSEGACTFLEADLREPGLILGLAARTLDLDRPVLITLMSLLHFINDAGDACSIVGRFLDAVPPGSVLALTHMTVDVGGPAVAGALKIWNDGSPTRAEPRTRDEVAALLTGCTLLEPGVEQPARWRAEDTKTPDVPLWAAAGTKQ